VLPSLSVQLTQFCSSLFSCIVSALINKIFIHSFIHSYVRTSGPVSTFLHSYLLLPKKIAAIGPIRHFVRHAHVVWQLPYTFRAGTATLRRPVSLVFCCPSPYPTPSPNRVGPRPTPSAGLMPTEARGNYLPEAPYLRETKTYLNCHSRMQCMGTSNMYDYQHNTAISVQFSSSLSQLQWHDKRYV